MNRIIVLLVVGAILAVQWLALQSGASFIGASAGIDKSFGNTINVDVDASPTVLNNTAFGLGDMDVGVTWGVGVDLGAEAGYPYDDGGVGAVSSGGLSYNLDLSLNSVSGGGFDGSGYGIPLDEQGITTTQLDKELSDNLSLNSASAILP